MLWALLAFLLVAITKYLTALRLRTLQEKIQKDRQTTDDLRRLLLEAGEKEMQLRSQTEELATKATILNNIVNNLEKVLHRSSEESKPSPTLKDG